MPHSLTLWCRGKGEGAQSVPLPELLEHDPVGEALATDPDALQDTVAAQLVQHEVRVQFPRLVSKGES